MLLKKYSYVDTLDSFVQPDVLLTVRMYTEESCPIQEELCAVIWLTIKIKSHKKEVGT
jgi:hypothetical protein